LTISATDLTLHCCSLSSPLTNSAQSRSTAQSIAQARQSIRPIRTYTLVHLIHPRHAPAQPPDPHKGKSDLKGNRRVTACPLFSHLHLIQPTRRGT
jgi:hypothetical protein